MFLSLKVCLTCRLQTLINYALKAERDLWGLLDGPWDGPDYADHRRTWSTQAGSLSFRLHSFGNANKLFINCTYCSPVH